MIMNSDVVIVGSGVAGLFCALNLPSHLNIIIITKDKAENSNSYLAQGGICVQTEDDDFTSYFNDTMRAGHFKNNKDAVECMISSSREMVAQLIALGVDFNKENGTYVYTKEGGHSKPRILFHKDITGKEITSKLLARVRASENIKLYEYEAMIDIITEDNVCKGIVSKGKAGDISYFFANFTVLACGGVGGLFKYSTNFKHITGDAITIALQKNIVTENLHYVQFHPTTLYTQNEERCLLISESARGEGAYLYNNEMQRFVDELQPRDIVTKAIKNQMKAEHKEYVWLDMKRLGENCIKEHFPNIYEECKNRGIDILRELIPVVPAQHYLMGGIKVNLSSRTSMENLYAVGETSCNGVHGANRLASNSLLESLVFSKRAAREIYDLINTNKQNTLASATIDKDKYADSESLMNEYKKILLEKIGRMKNE